MRPQPAARLSTGIRCNVGIHNFLPKVVVLSVTSHPLLSRRKPQLMINIFAKYVLQQHSLLICFSTLLNAICADNKYSVVDATTVANTLLQKYQILHFSVSGLS